MVKLQNNGLGVGNNNISPLKCVAASNNINLSNSMCY